MIYKIESNTPKKINKKSIFIVFLLSTLFLMGHGGSKHEEQGTVVETTKIVLENNITKEILKNINKAYIEDIKPIFKIKCFDCHGKIEKYPWYYKLPGIKQLMDSDMKEAKKHLDMSKDFPFISHEIPLKDLKSLKEVIEESDMPPFQYVLGHWDSRLTKEEEKKLYQWVEDSLEKLGEK